MTATNHALVGAFTGILLKQPVLVVPIAFASHFVLDSLPHFGYPSGGFSELFKHKLAYVALVFDLICLALLTYLLRSEGAVVWLGVIAALSPDVIWLYRYFWYERKGLQPPTDPVTNFHSRIQWCERPWGVAIEWPMAIILLTLLWRR